MTVMEETRWENFARIYNDVTRYPTIGDVAAALDISPRTVRNHAVMVRRLHESGEAVPALISRKAKAATVAPIGEKFRTIETLPEPYEEPVEDLLKRVIDGNERFATHHHQKSCIDLNVQFPGPYGVVGLPDHHLNNIGTLVRRAFDDAYVINQHPHLFAVGIGDWLDNFIVGFLERERRKDIMSHSDAWRLAEHYISVLAPKMIAAISGNHMDWTTSAGGVDVLKKMFDDYGLGPIYDTDQVRVRMNSPNGESFTHIARHKYRGNSRFNSVHAITVWILENWQGEDVVWGGHIHVAGHTSIEKQWMGRSRIVHGIQLGAYKTIDGYAKREAFRANQPFLTPMTIHVPETGETMFFEDMYRGIQVLDMLRKQMGYA
ncbi:hypothetical protein SAMN05216548_114137 [Faunimonas pinastri]|uniref:Uncharacterized protein n=1 Tax=Faunimonas pinastri TaxID=1855383 RepID=A0A1H9N0U8_9HYPH|nr:hypothetical protein [Faunimonas pinastri]SER29610.1 hypothetical protein SAMN05216548_114137 [Faunimonas pinastri]